MTDEALVLGLDVGGTSTRVLVATSDGARRGVGRAAGGNPTGLGPERAAAALSDALGQALAGLDPAAVRRVVIGLAGGASVPSGADLPGGEAFARAWARAGIDCPIEYEGDALIAFVAGTDEPEGSLLLSGTGAVAIAVKDRALAARADGHGWLLGDRGSGFWLGRQVVLAAMAELDGEGPATPLTGLVIEALRSRGTLPGAGAASANSSADRTAGTAGADTAGSTTTATTITTSATPATSATSATATSATQTPDLRSPARDDITPTRHPTARELVTAVMSEPPPALARLAPLLSTACAAGDPVAGSIADRAAAHLITTLAAVRGPDAATPVVLAGSILTNPTPVAERVRRVLRERWPAATTAPALDGAAAAAWLALARLGPIAGPEVRERLFSVSPTG